MTVALELDREAQRRGLKSAFVATGQTGIMISGNGLPVDRIISDFVAGIGAEKVRAFPSHKNWGFVDGHGAPPHPPYSPPALRLPLPAPAHAPIFFPQTGSTATHG